MSARLPDKVYSWFLVLTFGAFLYAPLVATSYNLAHEPETGREAKRAPAPRWGWSRAELSKLPGVAKWYFEDRYGLKKTLRYLHGLVMVRGLETSASAAVVLGRNDWLFLASENVLDYQRGARPLSDSAIEHWLREREKRRTWLAERGVSYALLIPPNTHTIYPEHLPLDLAPPGTTRLEQVVSAAARIAPRLRLIDVRATLLHHKPEARLYFKHDTHWNAVAGWLATQDVASALGLPALPGPLLPIQSKKTQGGDLARLLGLDRVYAEADDWPAQPLPLLTTEDGRPLTLSLTDVVYPDRYVVLNPAGRSTALVFRDSFGEALVPWVSALFAKTIWIGSGGFSDGVIQEEKPDFVIEQLVERKLMLLNKDTGTSP